MYKVMLVDDEQLILDGLQKIINWNEFDLEVTTVAKNGQEALEKFIKNNVDIIITDVNMPIKDGLSFVDEIKKINKHVFLIILSGYDEFSYAQQAISLGVEAYILKPVSESELKSILNKTIIKIEELATYNNSIKSNTNKTLTRELSYQQLEHCVEVMLNSRNINCYFITTILTNTTNSNLMDKIENVIKKNSSNIGSSFEIVYENTNKIHIINYLMQSIEINQAEMFATQILKELVYSHKIDAFVSFSKPIKTINELADEIKYLTKSIRFVLTDGFNKTITHKRFDDVKNHTIDATKTITYINNLIIDNKPNIIKKYIDNLFSSQLTPKDIDEISAKILILIDDIFYEFNLSEFYKKQDLVYSITSLCNKNNILDIKNYLWQEISKITSFMHNRTLKYTPVVRQSMRIIKENYSENITIKLLAKKLNVHPSYLGQLFYKETGESFSYYLNKIRNEKAKELILNTDMKISAIAQKVGYTDTSYFYKKFKKYHGIVPSMIRQIKN